MDIKNRTKAMKLAAPVLAATTLEQRNEALNNIAKELEKQKDAIFAANKLQLKTILLSLSLKDLNLTK